MQYSLCLLSVTDIFISLLPFSKGDMRVILVYASDMENMEMYPP